MNDCWSLNRTCTHSKPGSSFRGKVIPLVTFPLTGSDNYFNLLNNIWLFLSTYDHSAVTKRGLRAAVSAINADLVPTYTVTLDLGPYSRGKDEKWTDLKWDFFLGVRDVFDEPSCSELAFWSSAASVIWSLAVGSFIQFALTAGSPTPQLVASPAGGGGGARTPPSEFCWIFFFGRRWAKPAGFAAYRTYMCVCAQLHRQLAAGWELGDTIIGYMKRL